MLYSFDVFDTIITRAVAKPQDIFLLVQYRLEREKNELNFSQEFIHSYAFFRERAELIARFNYQMTEYETNIVQTQEDVTLHQIYEVMLVTGELTEEQIQYLMQLEIDTEIQNVLGIKENIDKIKALISQGNRVILISDMYLKGEIIRQMLMQVDEEIAALPLYVSVDIQKAKYSGSMYSYVQKKEGVEFEDWIHCGDNEYSDQGRPQWVGIQIEPYQKPRFSDFESKLVKKEHKTAEEALLAGISYYTCWQEGLCGVARIGADVGGPILYAYVAWMLKRCVKMNKKRLYFIARDGYILKKIADIIIQERKLDIETYYIYGSRKAWRWPSFDAEKDSLIPYISWSNTYHIRTIGDLAEVLGLHVDELAEFLPIEYRDGNRKIDSFELYILSRELDNDLKLKNLVQYKQAKNKELTKKYLLQEVDTNEADYAFVELAGGGFTQTCLAKLLDLETGEKITSFYFKLDRTTINEGCYNEVFMPCWFHLNLIIEMFCRAPYGQTMGYQEVEGKIIPCLQESNVVDDENYMEFVRGVELFTKYYVKQEQRNHIKLTSRDMIFRCMQYVCETPSPKVYEYFANIPNEQTGREDKPIVFAPKLTKKQIRDVFLLREAEPIDYYYQGSSFDYSLLHCSEFDKKLIEFYKKMRNTKYGCWVRNRFQKKRNENQTTQEFYLDIWQEKVILYAAGKVGQRFYEQIKDNPNSYIVQWIDKNPVPYREKGVPVEGIEKLGEVEYDQIVVAVKTWEAFKAIEKFLIEQGITKEKIFWLGNTYLNVRWV